MADKSNRGRAGIFKPWDGKLTGPNAGDPGTSKRPDRSYSWGSVQQKQTPQTFTADEVEQIVQRAIEAIQAGQPVPKINEESKKKVEEQEEEYIIGGK